MPGDRPVRNPTEAYQQLEAIMLRQMLQSSGAFRAGSTPGSQLRTDMFVETLADAVAKAGGLGIARMLEHQLGGGASGASPRAQGGLDGPPAWAIASPRGGMSLMNRPAGMVGPSGPSGSLGAVTAAPPAGVQDLGDLGDLEDPNSEAPLPEDPLAASIDDYQTGAAGGRTPAGPSIAPTTRALNRYRERVEATMTGNPASAAGGDKP